MQAREFDLNIEKVLENWNISHAVREIIANAIDEQILTGTGEIMINKDDEGRWHIRDFGRGLQYVHLTQNENEEKLIHPGLIGKFGVGLKDALATFDRHNIGVIIDSKYGHITIGKSQKHGFSDITTLHAYIDASRDVNMEGTDFCLSGCDDEDIAEAKDYFLCFAKLACLEKTEYGEVYSRRNNRSEIFINGVKVAEEENFLFSYNITSLNAALKKALNRERTNVGRSAYSDRIRSILLNVSSDYVIDEFTQNLTKMSDGTQCDEMKWVDVQTRAVKLLNSRKDTVFVTPDEIEKSSGRVLEIVKDSGKTPVFIPTTVKNRIKGEQDDKGNTISTIESVVNSYNQSFEYEFIAYEDLSEEEKANFDFIPEVLKMVGSKFKAENIYVSEHLKADTENDPLGLYEHDNNRIIIKRRQLANREDFLGTLIHELVHADTGFGDVSRSFESVLTERIGLLADRYFSLKEQLDKEQERFKNLQRLKGCDLSDLSSMKTDDLEQIVDKLEDEDNDEEVIRVYDELILRNSQNADYYQGRSSTYYQMKKYDNAIEDIQKAITLSKDNALYYALIGRYYIKKDNIDVAEQATEHALKLDSNCEVAFLAKSELALAKGLPDEAVSWAEKRLDVYPEEVVSYIGLCKFLLASEKYERAHNTATIALQKYPDNATLYYLRAFSNIKLDEKSATYIINKHHKLEEAENDIKKACEINPANINYYKRNCSEPPAYCRTISAFPAKAAVNAS